MSNRELERTYQSRTSPGNLKDLPLFAKPEIDQPRFDGETIDHERDTGRLNAQLTAVRLYLADGKWRTLARIAFETGHPEASISARIRDLRKPKFGGHTMERRYVERGLYEYRLVR